MEQQSQPEKGIGVPLLCEFEEAQKIIPLSRTKFWELARDGHIKTVNIGRRRFFLYESLVDFVRKLEADSIA